MTNTTQTIGVVNGATIKRITQYGDEGMARFRNMIDEAAGELRGMFITVSAGQDMVYLQKEREALAIKAATNPVDADYPLVSADSEIDGVTLVQAADAVLFKANVFRTIAKEIELMRMGAKKVLKTERRPNKIKIQVDKINKDTLATRLSAKGINMGDFT